MTDRRVRPLAPDHRPPGPEPPLRADLWVLPSPDLPRPHSFAPHSKESRARGGSAARSRAGSKTTAIRLAASPRSLAALHYARAVSRGNAADQTGEPGADGAPCELRCAEPH